METEITQEMIDEIRDAQEQIVDAVATLRQICQELNDQNAMAYLIEQLENYMADGHGNPYDLNIDKWVERLEERMAEQGDEGDSDEGDAA